MKPSQKNSRSTFGIFLLAVIPLILLFHFFNDAAQGFLDSRSAFFGSILAFALTYLIYRGENRKIQDMIATWIAIFLLFMTAILYSLGEIDRNVYGSYFLFYFFLIFWDWKRI